MSAKGVNQVTGVGALRILAVSDHPSAVLLRAVAFAATSIATGVAR